MKLIDALKEIEKDHKKYMQYEDSYFGYRYRDNHCVPFDCYKMNYIDPENRIVFYDSDLFGDGWTIHVIEHRYKIGDRFLIPDLCYENVKMGKTVSKTMFNNLIGEIIASCYDGEKIRYTVSLNGKGFPLLLTEDYLNKLDMVVSQNN